MTELLRILDMMIQRAELMHEGPITRRKRLRIWERIEVYYEG